MLSALCLQVYVLKRPHVDEFLQRMGELFECVLFTASLAKVRALLFPATCRVAQLPFLAHPWAALALCPLPTAGSASIRQRCLPAPP